MVARKTLPPEIAKPPKKLNVTGGISTGRAVGSTNKISRDLKEGIVEAAIRWGSDGKGTGGLQGFLKLLISSNRKEYIALLGKTMTVRVAVEPPPPQKIMEFDPAVLAQATPEELQHILTFIPRLKAHAEGQQDMTKGGTVIEADPADYERLIR